MNQPTCVSSVTSEEASTPSMSAMGTARNSALVTFFALKISCHIVKWDASTTQRVTDCTQKTAKGNWNEKWTLLLWNIEGSCVLSVNMHLSIYHHHHHHCCCCWTKVTICHGQWNTFYIVDDLYWKCCGIRSQRLPWKCLQLFGFVKITENGFCFHIIYLLDKSTYFYDHSQYSIHLHSWPENYKDRHLYLQIV